ncbi:protocadherin beta-18-like [Sinocyclocheilus grahami]|uniref:protocadherin beta-18-like n=1 Tax=Sinocyclocheilus grahami TaxID=75366 RepID=UPI0007AC9B25|nr:PREDICTED: protocadherin beta-18-like [Sinocyclocheilus grahami]
MEAGGQRRRWEYCWIALCISFLLGIGQQVSAQIRYSVPEEVKEGTAVGNIAKDLGLEVSSLVDRQFRIVSGSKEELFQINQENGVLYVHKKIDRESVCAGSGVCMVNLKTVIENPLEIHYVEVEISDINDHSPSFPEKEQRLRISENTLPGADYQLQAAGDPDSGTNSVRSYKLSPNDHFEIRVRESDEDKMPFLVLKKAVDREITTTYKLILTAVDGGNPPRSGTLNITITVLDINDNRPVFSRESYSVTLSENSVIGTMVVRVNATDMDEGTNSDIEYSFSTLNSKVHEVFELDQVTGEIRVKGEVDFEDTEVYKLDIQASDKGHLPMSANCRVVIKIIDVNDNRPEIEITSLSKNIPEDSKPGTVISLVSVTDKDAGINGKVICQLNTNIPFELKPSFKDNMYSLVTKDRLDREMNSRYDITITASDLGQPSLTASTTLSVQISDVNDNAPEFLLNPLDLYLMENNAAGSSIISVSASDRDTAENAVISYHIIRGDGTQNDLSSFLNINSETGIVYSLKSFDFETLKSSHFHALATDSGTPSLSSNVTNNVTFYLIITLGSVSVLFVISIIVLIVMQCSKSTDYSSKYLQETNYDGTLCHSIQYRSGDKRYMLVGPRMSIGSTIVPGSNGNTLVIPDRRRRYSGEENCITGIVVIRVNATDMDEGPNSDIEYSFATLNSKVHEVFELDQVTGIVYSLKSFDFETAKTFQFHVLATDSGTPSLSSNVTVNVFILDQNDNVPVILYPVSANGSAEGVEEIPRNVNAGHLEVSDHSLFGLDRYTGQIRTLRSFTETDEAQHKLLILVKDNGNVSLSATATVIVKVVEPKEAFAASDIKNAVKDEEENNCSKSTDYSSKYLQDTNYDGTLCHSIQYRSGDKRYMLVGPRMSVGSTIVPGSNGNTLVIPDRRRRGSGEVCISYCLL